MTLQNAVLDSAVDGATALLAFMSIHTADPGGSGANEVAGGGYTRVAVSWDPSSGGIAALSGTPVAFSGPAGGAATYVGLWSAISGGTWRGGAQLTGDQTFNAAGAYNINAATLTISNA